MTDKRSTPIEIGKEDFKKIGYQLVDTIADFIDNIDKKPVTSGTSPKQLQEILGTASLPENSIFIQCNHPVKILFACLYCQFPDFKKRY